MDVQLAIGGMALTEAWIGPGMSLRVELSETLKSAFALSGAMAIEQCSVRSARN
jgi:hypothetical protein